MPSSGSSARIASRKPICGASLSRRAAHLGLPLLHFGAAGGTLGSGERLDQPAQDGLGVADQRRRRPRETLRLLGIGIDTDDGKLGVESPTA